MENLVLKEAEIEISGRIYDTYCFIETERGRIYLNREEIKQVIDHFTRVLENYAKSA